MDGLRPPGHVNFKSKDIGVQWQKWKKQFTVYFAACELSKKSKETQCAILLHAAGPEALEISETFTWLATDDKEDYKLLLQKFDNYCEPKRNVVYERYEFWSRNFREDEPFDSWVTFLRNKAKLCEFGEQELSLIRDKIVYGIRDLAVKERLLREANLTLDKCLDICRAVESSRQQARSMMSEVQATEPEVNFIKKKHFKQQNGQPYHKKSYQISNCYYCGESHVKGKCPAYGKTCAKCGNKNHFASVCRGQADKHRSDNKSRQNDKAHGSKKHKTVHALDITVQDEQGYGLFIGALNKSSHKWQETLLVEGLSCNFRLDTGADANVMPMVTIAKLGLTDQLSPTTQPLRAFGGSKVMPLGLIKLLTVCSRTGISLATEFYVTDTADIPILGNQACEDFGLIHRVFAVDSVARIDTKDTLIDMYADVFQGLGKYDEPYKITVDPAVPPVIQRSRKVPYAKLPVLKATLDKLEAQGVIAPTNKPTDWVNNLVITEKKNGELRLCLDPKPLNNAIKRERHTIPTAEDVQAQLCGKSIFTVVDMKDSYWQICLEDESSYLCTFHTPWGRKRFLRMPFGLCSAGEVMQKRNEATFSDIPGVHVIADDLIIAATSDEQHNEILHKVMRRARSKNIRFNRDKLQFKMSQVSYMGNIVTATGLKPCPKKIDAIVNMPTPADKPALQRLLGMIRYLAQFIPNESALTAPLRELLKKDAPWNWNHEHASALDAIKQAIARPTMLKFFDVDKPVLIQTDASQSGLGACLLQEKHPIAFASRALTKAEENYSQIEKELLAICFGCAKFHQYTYGREVEIHTDHRPLETIFKKPLIKAAPRLQRMLLQLQRYVLKVTYVPGRLMYIADTLSRAYLEGESDYGAAEEAEIMVHQLLDSLPMTAAKRDNFKQAISRDSAMRRLVRIIADGWPKSRRAVSQDLQPYWNVRDQLHEAHGLLFCGDRIIVPPLLRPEMLSLIHESHLGIKKCQARAREVLYWPGMCADIEKIVSKCEVCIALRSEQTKEPLLPHQVPDRPWQKLAADIMLCQNKDYLVVTDYYSKYVEIALLERKTAACVILHLKSIMARHGIPEQLCTDNMPFNSVEFLSFATAWNFTLVTSSPNYPQSNGQAERTVQTIKQLLTKAMLSGQDPYIALLEYRNTPVAGLPLSPAQMLMSRRLRSKLPVTAKHLKPAVVNAKPLLKQQQRIQKRHYDRGSKPLPPLQSGDSVHIRKGKRWTSAVIVRKTQYPRSYIVECGGVHYRRNRRQILHTPNIRPKSHYSAQNFVDYEPEVIPAPAVPDTPPAVRVPPVPMAPAIPTSPQNENAQINDNELNEERPRRQVKKPSYLNEFVT